MQLGNLVKRALDAVGITQERAERLLGDCGCAENQERLNRLGRWAARILIGKVERAGEYLDSIAGDK